MMKSTKTPKKLLTFILSAAMLLSLSSAAAFAADDTPADSGETIESEAVSTEDITANVTDSGETSAAEEVTTAPEETIPVVGDIITVGDYIYKINGENTVAMRGFSDGISKTQVIVPNTISYNGITYKVIKVGNSAFLNETKIKKVTIRKNVTDIGKNAFSGCTKLTKVTMRTGVTIIRKNAFKNCKKLKTVNITSTALTDIKKNAFKGIKSGAVINVMNKATRILVKASVPSGVTVNKM